MNKTIGRKVLLTIALLTNAPGCGRSGTLPANNTQASPAITSQSGAENENATSAPAVVNDEPLKVVGYFTNVKRDRDGEHEWGYSVHLWAQGALLYGLIDGDTHLKLAGDPRAGELLDVVFDPQSGRLSFRSKLSLSERNEQPTRDIYKFEGVLTKTKLSGKLVKTDESCDDGCEEIESISLRRSRELGSLLMQDYENYAEWRKYADRILRFRGPRW